MFAARPPSGPSARRDLHLVRCARRAFTGGAEFLADPGNRARVGEYLADMARPYGHEVRVPDQDSGQSYGEMAEALIGSAVPPDEPADLLVLAFSVHDMRPGRQTAAYLSHLTPGAPMAFAVCDQGSAAAFSGLRIVRGYAASAGIRRALLIVVEQAALPYDCPAPLPAQHRGVAMLYDALAPPPPGALAPPPARLAGARQGTGHARLAGLCQHPGVPPDRAAGLAAACLAELAAGRDAGLVLSAALAAVWAAPGAASVRVTPPGQPSTGLWWGLIDEVTGDASRPGLLVAADYDPGLRYLCLAAFDTC